MTDYVEIRNWNQFQHYKNRNPPWIKTYTELLSDEAYLGLSGHRRAILHGLWLECARSHRRLPHDTRSLSSRLGLRVTTADLVSLSEAGFITLPASTLLARRYQDASPETETDRETEKKDPVPAPTAEANYDAAGAGAGDFEEAEEEHDFERLNPHTFLPTRST